MTRNVENEQLHDGKVKRLCKQLVQLHATLVPVASAKGRLPDLRDVEKSLAKKLDLSTILARVARFG